VGMNLHAIAAPFINVVNPAIVATWLPSNGYATDPTGMRAPQYDNPVIVSAQVQALSSGELELMEGLNIQGVKRAMYLDGDVKGVDRALGDGGDLIVFDATPDVPAALAGTTWLVSVALEPWDTGGWCKVGVVKQNAA
jgi:hypothetical protein